MTTFSDRLNQIIAESGLTKTAFAKRIEVSQGFVSQLTSGSFNPSARTISAICREFNVRREWLENGEEPMRSPDPDPNLDRSYIDILMDTCRSPFPDLVRAILIAYDRASPAGKQAINDYIQQVKAELGEK